MTGKEIIKRVSALAEPICAANGLSLWDVTFEKTGRSYMLTVFVDRESGVNIDDCERVSRAVDPLLDGDEFASLPPYTFSVSSAGLQRRLTRPEHFEWAVGKSVDIAFYKARGGQNGMTAVFRGRQDDAYLFSTAENEDIKIPAAEIADVRLHFDF